jgi:hypothetical protein
MGYHLGVEYSADLKKFQRSERVNQAAAGILQHVLLGYSQVPLQKSWNSWKLFVDACRAREQKLDDIVWRELCRTFGQLPQHAQRGVRPQDASSTYLPVPANSSSPTKSRLHRCSSGCSDGSYRSHLSLEGTIEVTADQTPQQWLTMEEAVKMIREEVDKVLEELSSRMQTEIDLFVEVYTTSID